VQRLKINVPGGHRDQSAGRQGRAHVRGRESVDRAVHRADHDVPERPSRRPGGYDDPGFGVAVAAGRSHRHVLDRPLVSATAMARLDAALFTQWRDEPVPLDPLVQTRFEQLWNSIESRRPQVTAVE
jgi:hypothetical protein